jgi:hypothetical protein
MITINPETQTINAKHLYEALGALYSNVVVIDNLVSLMYIEHSLNIPRIIS